MMSNLVYPENFWDLLLQFNITNLSQLTKLVEELDKNYELQREYGSAYALVKDFEAMIRSNIYTEHHAQEYFNDAEAPHLA